MYQMQQINPNIQQALNYRPMPYKPMTKEEKTDLDLNTNNPLYWKIQMHSLYYEPKERPRDITDDIGEAFLGAIIAVVIGGSK